MDLYKKKLGIRRFITNQQNIYKYKVTPVHYLQKAEKNI